MRKRIVFVMMIFFIGLSLTGCPKQSSTSQSRINTLESQIQAIDKMMPEIDTEIAKHQGNIQKMRDRLQRAQATGTKPDVSGLRAYATAAGARTQDYHQAPAWTRTLVDKLEGMHLFNVLDASRLAAATASGNVEQVYISNEINRSSRFIKMLEVFKSQQEKIRANAQAELDRIKKELSRSSISTIDTDLKDNGGY